MKIKFKHVLAAAALSLSSGAWAEAPKYIFYYIGDGMGMGPITATQTYKRTIEGSKDLLTMMQFEVASICLTYSSDSDITDSAAAGTALATGNKTRNGMLGMNADTISVESVAAKLHNKGYGVGVTTSVAPDDATPGAFYAHVPSRKKFYEIDTQMAESGYEFIAGAGLRGLNVDGKDTDLLSKFAANDVQIVRGPAEIANINNRRVLLLNTEGTSENNIGYTIDSISNVLTLPKIAETCLAHLEKTTPDGFFMMVEGGNIDHALHANDGGAAIKEIINFNEALDVAYKFYLAHPDETLIVVTADHDTGGMANVNPRGAKGGLANIDCQRVSKEQFGAYCSAMLRSRRTYTWEDMKEYLADNLGLYGKIQPTEEQDSILRQHFDRTFEQRNSADQQTLYASFNEFAVEVFSIFNEASGLAFTTTGHSANPVPVFAIGVGAEKFQNMNNNIELPGKILEIVEEK